jgi:uncharacterized Zn-binding protein involved in type VI secretion
MPAAARVGDPTGHPGVVGPPGVPSVLIGGQPAATVGTSHQCGSAAAHPPSALAAGSSSVLIGGKPAARVGDAAACGSPVVSGCPSVQVGG